MRKIILLIIFAAVAVVSTAQSFRQEYLQPDKAQHIAWTSVISSGSYLIAKDYKFRNPEMTAIIFTMSVGYAKEFLWDKPNPSAPDILANSVGCITGIYLTKLLNREFKFQNKKQRIRR